MHKKYILLQVNVILFQWLEEEFLGYLDEWERSVNEIKSLSPLQKKMMLLPHETLTGLRITGWCELSALYDYEHFNFPDY